MPSVDFYAVGDDFGLVLDFIYEQPGWRLMELSSRPDQPLQRFASRAEVESGTGLGTTDAYLMLHTEAMAGRVIERPITFTPGAVPGATGRTDIGGWGLIQVYLMTPRDGRIRPSHVGHNSEARAHRWEDTYGHLLGPAGAWNWAEVNRTAGRLARFVRKLGAELAGSRIVLPEAAAVHAGGADLAPNA